MRINFKLFDLSIDKIKEEKEYYIELYEEFFKFGLEFVVDKVNNEEDNDDILNPKPSVEEGVYENQLGIYGRDNMTGVELFNLLDKEVMLWTLRIILRDRSPMYIKFQSRKECLKYFNLIGLYITHKLDLTEL